MAQRSEQTQSLHDRVITEITPMLNSQNYDIYTNPGESKNAGIVENYPDIIMTEKGTKTVKFILEVETHDSINLTEAESQWKKYATDIKATFYLVVPEQEINRANELCKKVGVNVRFSTYSLENNILSFKFR